MVEINKLLNVNITSIFSDIDVRFIDSKAFQLIAELEEDPYGSSFLRNPNGIQLILPQSKITIIIDKNRVQILDDYVKTPEESQLITRYFKNVNELTKMFDSQVYGFNYLVQLKGDLPNLLSEPMKKIVGDKEIRAEGTRVVFVEDKVRYDLRVEKIQDSLYSFQLNVERDGNFRNMEDPVTTLNREFIDGYTKLKEIVNVL